MKKYFFVLVSFSFLMVQCHKESNNFIKVSGKVLEFGSNRPIANAKVAVYEEGGTFLGSTWTNLVDSTHTDANGCYTIEKQDIDVGGSYFVAVSASKYWRFDPTKYLAIGKDVTNYDVTLEPLAWLKVHVKNVNPFDDNDVIFTNGSSYTGKSFEKDFNYTVSGNKNLTRDWVVRKNGISVLHLDTIYIPAHDTIKYEILY